MATVKESYADKIRRSMRSKAEGAAAGGGNGTDFNPDFGTTRIRVLPPIGEDFPKNINSIDENSMFYHSHKFHFIPESIEDIGTSKGKFLWVGRTFTDKNGREQKNPIAEAVAQFYTVGRKENDADLLKLGGALKLKRNFYMNIIKYNDDGSYEYRTLTDKTNEGKLIKVICAAMGLPFFRDIDDNWVDKNSIDYDEDQEYYDLVDVENGFDFKIVKEKTGVNPWDISFEKSFVMKKKPRALDEDELALMGKRIDLKKAVQYETSFEVMKGILDGLMGDDEEDNDKPEKSERAPAKESAKTKIARPTPPMASSPVAEEVNTMDDDSMDDLLNELD